MSELPEKKSRFLTACQLSCELGISEQTLANWIKRGEFPAPLRLGLRRYVWLRVEFENYVQSRIEERDREGLKNYENC